MKKIIILGQAVLAASIIAAPVAIMNAATASAQPTPAPADVCFDGPTPHPHRPGDQETSPAASTPTAGSTTGAGGTGAATGAAKADVCRPRLPTGST